MVKLSKPVITIAVTVIVVAGVMGLPQVRGAIGQAGEGSCSAEVVVTAIPGIVKSGGGGGGGSTTSYTGSCEIDMLGEIVEVRFDRCNNSTMSRYVIYGPESDSYLTIDRGTSITCGDCVGCGSYPSLIEITRTEDFPDAPEGAGIIAAYECIGYKGNSVCPHVTFGKPILLLLKYGPAELPDGTSLVFIARYNMDTGEWEPLPPDTVIVSVAGEVTALINQLSTFAIIAEIGQPESPQPSLAHFVASGLNINASRDVTSAGNIVFVIKEGESVEISANVANDGGQSGEYSAVLKINGETESTRNITLGPGQSQELVFNVTGLTPGAYAAQIDGLTVEFTVTRWTNYPLIAGIATASGLSAWAIWYFLHRRRRQMT